MKSEDLTEFQQNMAPNTSTIVVSRSMYLNDFHRSVTTVGYSGFDFIKDYAATYANDPKKERNENLEILQELCATEVLALINSELSEDEINDFGSLLKYTVGTYSRYGTPQVLPVIDNESGEFGYFNIILDGCNWNEWEELSLDLFDRTGQVKGKVVVTCLKGLTE